MLTGSDLLERIEGAFPGGVRRTFQFPFTRLRISSPAFGNLDDDERESHVAAKIGLPIGGLSELCNRLFIRLDLVTGAESPSPRDAHRGHFWMRELAESEPQPDPVRDIVSNRVPVIHFYGYKGGQARSSVLCFLSRVLASEGWRVLAVDVDAEAPSLDILFNARPPGMSSSLLGIRAGLRVVPVRVVSPRHERGHVDLLPFRPIEERYDLDAAALAMEGNIHPSGLEKLVSGVARLVSDYDIVLVDHRTGLASTVPPWVRHLPGPVVAFARMDGQWRHAKAHLRKLWSHSSERPGLLVSYNADRGEGEEDHRKRVWDQAAELLDELASAMGTGAVGGDEPLTAQEVSDHWVIWPYDGTFSGVGVPDPERVGGTVKEKAYQIRRILGLEGAPKRSSSSAAIVLKSSGAIDEGDLIQTQALRDLRGANNPYTFILGRKGTGKTRLLRTLSEEKLGEALLVPEDDRGTTGVEASNTFFKALVEDTSSEPERLWWTLLSVALERGDTDRAGMSSGLENVQTTMSRALTRARDIAARIPDRRLFLVDGLETAFPRAKTFDFVGALFRMVATLSSDPVFCERVRVRIFIRTDLAERGYENFEQQAEGRTLYLRWDTKTILNFALSRIGRLSWFKERFPEADSEIERKRESILEGALSEQDCDALLHKIFPTKLTRLNLNTTTFLRTYFSDDPKGQGSYYPRIYDDFLRNIAAEGKDARKEFSGPELEEGRVSDALVNFAHEKAARGFLLQVRAELLNLVDLPQEDLFSLIDAFRDTVTPFDVEKRSLDLSARTNIEKAAVRQALERMKTLGIFEDRPRYPGQWRAGRLFKTSLGMIYDRKRKLEAD